MAQKRVYDTIIVRSGAAGGVAAHVLVNKGLDVLCTLTIMALAWRACDYLAEELRRGSQ